MGRPKTLGDDVEAYLRLINPELQTRRSLHNRRALLRAISVLKNDPRFVRLVPPTDSSTPAAMPLTVLTELGRIEDDGRLRDVALSLCRLERLDSRTAIGHVRAVRLAGRRKPADAVALGTAVDRAIVAYRRVHPDCTPEMVRAALVNLHDAYGDEE